MLKPTRIFLATTMIAALTACTPGAQAPAPGPAPVVPGLPPVPLVEGPLSIRVVYPPANMPRPAVDSVLVYGSIGNGRAALTINGFDVSVAPNGGFIGFLPRPADDSLRLVATLNGQASAAATTYRPPPPPAAAAAAPATIDYPAPRGARVSMGSDTLATGSDAAAGRPTPTGTYRWFLPIGARLSLSGERADMVRARLDSATEAWFSRDAVSLTDEPSAVSILLLPTVIPSPAWTDVRTVAAFAPFRVEANDSLLHVTIHGVTGSPEAMAWSEGSVRAIEMTATGTDAISLTIRPRARVWGYKAFYETDGTLVVRIRNPPTIDPTGPLRGIRIAVDPGHPPGGAMGPTGLAEADANLGISLRLAERLRMRGADVLLTRTTSAEVSLPDRVDMASAWDAHLLVSVHNNAFPEGANPFRRNGTSTYYFHDFAGSFARALQQEILSTTLTRDLGTLTGNLALVRPTWMPTVLTESLFMPIPEQEAALRDPLFLEQLAEAHLRGIERFLRGIQR